MRYTTETFIQKAKTLFPDYDYSKVNYIRSDKKVIIICPEHGDFLKKPADLLIRKGCPTCGRILGSLSKRSKNYLIKYTLNHEEEYYDPVFLDENLDKRMLIFCNICGKPFISIKSNFISGCGCPYCCSIIFSKMRMFTKEQFIEKSEKIHGKHFDYSRVVYKGKSIKVEIGCPICGNYFWQTPEAHWKKCGCQFCKMSVPEQRIYNYLKNNNISFEYEIEFPDLRDKNNLSYDFYIKDYNLLIEYNGEQHYSQKAFGKNRKDFLLQKHHDWLKRKYAKKNSFNFLAIPYWKDEIEELIECLKKNGKKMKK